MNYILNIFQKSFLNDENKFINLLSFFLMSFLCMHFMIYLNFFKFSDSWINNESRIVTIQISPDISEKKIPQIKESEILQYFEEKKVFEYVHLLTENDLKAYLGLGDLHSLSSVRVPLFLNLKFNNEVSEINFENFSKIIENRNYKVTYHKDEILEIEEFFFRVKLFIIVVGILIFILFLFFLILIINGALTANYKFLEVVQLMGADSKQISINISVIFIKKILIGTISGSFFSVLISYSIVKIFSIPFYNHIDISSTSFYGIFELFFYLSFFIIFTLMVIFLLLTLVTFKFLEKRFFG